MRLQKKKNEKFSAEMKIQRQRKKSNERMRKEQTFAKMGRFGAYEVIKTLDSPSMITSILELGRSEWEDFGLAHSSHCQKSSDFPSLNTPTLIPNNKKGKIK